MGLQHRARIFELRSQINPETGKLYSFRKIADLLGVSVGVVEKEVYRKASDRLTDDGEIGSGGAHLPGLPADPLLAEAAAGLQSERVEIQRLNLTAQRLKAERELQLLRQAPGDSSGALILVIEKLGNLMSKIDQLAGLAARQAAPVAAAATGSPPTPIEYLTQLRQGWEAVQSIGGQTKPPSTAAELEMTIAYRRLNMEAEERQRRLDEELEERRAERKNGQIRSEAIAEQIRQWGPLLAQGAQSWIGQQNGQQGGTPATGPSLGGGSPAVPSARPALAVLHGQAGAQPMTQTPQGASRYVEGRCPSCGAPLGIEPGPDDACPECHLALAVVNGRIMPKMPESDSPHFAS